MKFSSVKENILDELQLFQGIVEKRNTMPILANILMNVSRQEVELTGTDLEVGLRTHFEADIESPGAITVNGKKIFEIVKSLPFGQTVSFEQKDDLTMEIRAGESEFKVLCLAKEDYPQVPEPKFEKGIRLPLDVFKQMIDRVYYAITQEQRYYLNGALLSLKNDHMELISTDGHRLSFTSKSVDGLKPEKDISVIVAKKTLSEIRKFENEALDFDFDENNLFFRVDNRTLISRIIESKFPNYQAVIPKDNPNELFISREELADAIRRVSLLSTERSRGIKFYLEKNKVRLYSSNPEIGEARDKLDVEYTGQDLEIGFNSQYLLDFLTTVTGERVCFEIRDENSAVLLRPEAEDGVKNIYVLMPMKI
ncbi:MAG TPA: DNA polymerase III subunit beta [Candidatus Aminicenantes bacterium]|nr:DNA polymerase III subunit beta [Candidatus Aminicenantes bacterium]